MLPSLIKEILLKGSPEEVKLLASEYDLNQFFNDNTEDAYHTPLTFLAAQPITTNFVSLLATGKVDVHMRNAEGESAIDVAIECGNTEAVADLYRTNEVYPLSSHLFKAYENKYHQVMEVIIDQANAKDCLATILKDQNRSIDIFQQCYVDKDRTSLSFLLKKIKNYRAYTSSARLHDFVSDAGMGQIDGLKKTEYDRPESIADLSNDLSVEAAFQYLFNDSFPTDNSKPDIRKPLAEYYALLNSPHRCIKYLQFLNAEFLRYYKEKYGEELPKLKADCYAFHGCQHGYSFPYPMKRMNFKRQHAFEEFLICFLRKHGLANKTYKWIGFIPDKYAHPILSRGDFFVEDKKSELGLLHGSLPHMIQSVLQLLGMEDGVIDKEKHYTASEIQKAFIDVKSKKEPSWILIRDITQENEISFSDPYRVDSILRQGHKFGFGAIADDSIHLFCTGLHKILKRNIALIEVDGVFRVDVYIDKIKTLFYKQIISRDFDMGLIHFKYFLGLYQSKKNVIIGDNRNRYILVEKNYHPLDSFKPRVYSDESKLREKINYAILDYVNRLEQSKNDDKIRFFFKLKSDINFDTVPVERILKSYQNDYLKLKYSSRDPGKLLFEKLIMMCNEFYGNDTAKDMRPKWIKNISLFKQKSTPLTQNHDSNCNNNHSLKN